MFYVHLRYFVRCNSRLPIVNMKKARTESSVIGLANYFLYSVLTMAKCILHKWTVSSFGTSIITLGNISYDLSLELCESIYESSRRWCRQEVDLDITEEFREISSLRLANVQGRRMGVRSGAVAPGWALEVGGGTIALALFFQRLIFCTLLLYLFYL